jgi:hypothetical protein
MKKYFVILLMLVAFQLCFSQTYYVDPTDPSNYDTIQSAVNDAISDGGSGTVYVCNPNTNGSSYTYTENINVNFHNNEEFFSLSLLRNQSVGQGEIIISSPLTTSNVVSVSGRFDGVYFLIDGFTICNGYFGIQLTDLYLFSAYINNCIIRDNTGGVFADDSMPNFDSCKITNNSYNGFSEAWNAAVTREIGYIKNSEISNNGNDGLNLESSWDIINSTIVSNNGTGIDGWRWFNIKSSIIRDNTQQIVLNNYYEVEYSNIEDGFVGTGNIDADPLFVDPLNGVYKLTQLSPCVDAGDPTSPLDPDGTTIEMGRYYYPHPDYDIHHLSKGYNWESFSRIGTEPNGNVATNLVDVLYDIEPFTDITNINMQADETTAYELTYNGEYWSPPSYLAQSSWLYKIEILPEEERLLTVDGERLPVDFTLEDEDPLGAGEYHWLGFWLPRPQKMIESFGDNWQYVEKVKSEDWYFNKCSIARGGDPYGGEVVISAEDLIINPGKGYMVWFKDLPQPITDFHWTLSDAAEEPRKKAEPESFTYTEKADYEAVDVFNIPPSVTEIGVFEDDICVGAVVVEDTCAQILVYSDYANRDPIPFTFEVVTGRGFSTPIKDYQVLNLQTGKYEAKSIFSGRQEYSILRFGDEDEPEDNTLSTPQLYGNYPNPFNPTTTISFSLPNEQEIELTIFNIKGQKVKTLYSGSAEVGEHTVIWEGKDNNDKRVSSGIYFYKLKTNNKELTRKMLMMK